RHRFHLPSPFDDYPPHPDLHSFPTRRSSDLSRYSNDVTTPKFPPPPRIPQKRSPFSFGLAVRNRPSAVTTSAESRLSHVRPCFRDRKSTRLNSSHVAISYAVFCLKKKT